MAKWQMSDEEFDRQFEEATKRGQEALRTQPRAKSAYYDAASGRVVVELLNGCTFVFPAHLAQGLRDASSQDLAEVKVMPHGFALRWEKLDADFTLEGLMAGRFGSKRWMEQLRSETEASGDVNFDVFAFDIPDFAEQPQSETEASGEGHDAPKVKHG